MQDAIILYENGKAIGGEGHPTNASDITFDNTGTDLVSENVEDAIKEVNEKVTPRTDIATVESGTTASKAYSVGELVYVGGALYKVRIAIASGATFTVDTNIVATNISNVINTLFVQGVASNDATSIVTWLNNNKSLIPIGSSIINFGGFGAGVCSYNGTAGRIRITSYYNGIDNKSSVYLNNTWSAIS